MLIVLAPVEKSFSSPEPVSLFDTPSTIIEREIVVPSTPRESTLRSTKPLPSVRPTDWGLRRRSRQIISCKIEEAYLIHIPDFRIAIKIEVGRPTFISPMGNTRTKDLIPLNLKIRGRF